MPENGAILPWSLLLVHPISSHRDTLLHQRLIVFTPVSNENVIGRPKLIRSSRALPYYTYRSPIYKTWAISYLQNEVPERYHQSSLFTKVILRWSSSLWPPPRVKVVLSWGNSRPAYVSASDVCACIGAKYSRTYMSKKGAGCRASTRLTMKSTASERVRNLEVCGSSPTARGMYNRRRIASTQVVNIFMCWAFLKQRVDRGSWRERLLLVHPTLSKPPKLFRAATQIRNSYSHPSISTTSPAFEK